MRRRVGYFGVGGKDFVLKLLKRQRDRKSLSVKKGGINNETQSKQN